ncbi:MAG: 4-diphosphocytidyl-2-C-methyl-D-erythritol kinase [Acidimicrobiales bacterium AG-410-I20]|nr:MAG: 4-diphosphocytidyl-2-C-methyl-D-erythritol kinase [Acidimicrobiales bacterium AG-410-I20]
MKEKLTAPAKLTLSLKITGRRPDGYHFIDAEMVSLDFSDQILITQGDGLEIKAAESGFTVDTGPENLVSRAMDLIGEKAFIHIDKKIPSGAGLGGGSTNAAAILRQFGFDDLTQASSIGADVAYCLIGGRARVSGIGEVIEPLPFLEKTFTLLIPPIGVPTPEIYKHWDEMGGPAGENGNDLEPALLSYMPEMIQYKKQLASISGKQPQLAGSGGTWFVEGEFFNEDCRVVKTVPSNLHGK